MIDVEDVLTRGGEDRIALLQHCVMAVRMEPVFIFLAQEYRLRPGQASALALYDLFCAQQAPARLAAYELLPPRQQTLSAAIERIRGQWIPEQSDQPPDAADPVAALTPARNLFDAIVGGLRNDPRLAELAASYDPRLTPQENLPGGKMTAAQRQFVDSVWRPIVKPRLGAAGFWQMSTIG